MTFIGCTTVIVVSAVCAALGTNAAAQDTRESPKAGADQKSTDLHRPVTLDKLVGAKVKLGIPTNKAGEAEQPQPAKPKHGEIDDVIIDVCNGRCTWAIVGVGGLLGIGEKDVAVPCEALRREIQPDEKPDDTPTYILSATQEELKTLQAIKKSDLKSEDKQKLEMAVREAEASWKTLARQPGHEGDAKPASTRKHDDEAAPLSWMLGKSLDDYKLLAASKEFGSVSKCIFDSPATPDAAPALRYFVVTRGGVAGIGDTLYLVPVAACKLVRSGDTLAWSVSQTTEQIEKGGVQYKKPDQGVLTRDLCTRAHEFFNVPKDKDHDMR